jgi:4-aminobutyrate aminotransferase
MHRFHPDVPSRGVIVTQLADPLVPVSSLDPADDGWDLPRLVTAVPGPRTLAQVERDERVTSPSLPRAYPFAPVRGRGCVVEDLDGNRYLDFAAGIAVNSTGHAHPRVVAAIQAQAAELLHYSASDFYLPIYAETCERLAGIAPFGGPARVYLGNSGAEVVEAAIKVARFATRRQHVVSFLGAFHGRTYGALSLTASKAKYHAGFGPLLPGIHHAPYGHVADLAWFDQLFERVVPASEVAAIVVEPIQGEGGYIVPQPGFLAGLRAICDRHGILLVADEIQSGAGRTGRMWAVEHEGVEPDILLTAKGIASGMPIAAMVTRASILEAWPPGAHGSTYGGNPVACAAALATIELFEKGDLLARSRALGDRLARTLSSWKERFPAVGDARGLGLMRAIELVKDRKTKEPAPEAAKALVKHCYERGVVTLTAGTFGNCLRFLPPLAITDAQLSEALAVVESGLA